MDKAVERDNQTIAVAARSSDGLPATVNPFEISLAKVGQRCRIRRTNGIWEAAIKRKDRKEPYALHWFWAKNSALSFALSEAFGLDYPNAVCHEIELYVGQRLCQ